MVYTKNDEAVSPVIGVILMVAITVILAAVIAAFVFGMAGGISSTKNIAITAQRTGDETIVLTNMGGQDIGALQSVSVSGDVTTPGAVTGITSVGSTAEIDPNSATNAHIILTGTFSDGSQQVILDTYL